jgi:hypothetical protein
MWNITSSSVQHAKDELMVRRTEFETRYAEERQALDAELAVIETLERAASDFMVRHAVKAGEAAAEAVPPVDPPGAEGDGSAAENAGVPLQPPERGGTEAVPGAMAAPSAAETGSAAGDDVGPGLDILKPGSRWRFYRGGGHLPDPEGTTGEPSASDG